MSEPSGTPGMRRRDLVRAAALAGTSLLAAGAAAGGVSYADTEAARHRAKAVKPEPGRLPSSTRLVWRADTDEKVLALTFDDGPDPAYTVPLLDLLDAERVRATFFVVGRRGVEHPALLRRTARAGHEVGNHTWGHTDLSRTSRAETREELTATARLVEDVTGRAPTVLRPPWGRISGTSMQVAAEQGLDVLVWDVALQERERDAAGNVDLVLGALAPGMVLLAHDAGPGPHSVGVAAMPGIIRGARARGYRFVTASELLSLDRSPAR